MDSSVSEQHIIILLTFHKLLMFKFYLNLIIEGKKKFFVEYIIAPDEGVAKEIFTKRYAHVNYELI